MGSQLVSGAKCSKEQNGYVISSCLLLVAGREKSKRFMIIKAVAHNLKPQTLKLCGEGGGRLIG